MTTIAYKAGVLVGDSQATADYKYRVKKISRLPDGSMVGFCGVLRKCTAAVDWMQQGCQGEPPDFDDAQLLMVRTDGSLWIAEGQLPAYRLQDKFAAIGCGAAMAVGAMAAGASAVDAVKICCKLDPGTSGPIHTLKLK